MPMSPPKSPTVFIDSPLHLRLLGWSVLWFALLASLVGCTQVQPNRVQALANSPALSVSLSPQSELALVGSLWHGASLWHLETEARRADWRHQDADDTVVRASAFSPDGRFAVTADEQSIVAWNVETSRPVGYWSTQGWVRSVAISNGGRYVLAGLSTQQALWIDASGQRQPSFIPHAESVGAVLLSADGLLGVTGADDGMVRVWDLANGEALMAQRLPSMVVSLALSADESRLFAAPDWGMGVVWNWGRGEVLSQVGSPRTGLTRASFSADGTELLTASPSSDLAVWSVRDGRELRRWTVPPMSGPDRMAVRSVLAVGWTPRPGEVKAALSTGEVMTWSP
ncbi:MAG: hypothetical protein U1D28_06380 [Burkholderiales bacterium]|nr:hypothetical protein [Burkholderiales bacterium]